MGSAAIIRTYLWFYTCSTSVLWILIMCMILHGTTQLKLVNNTYGLCMLKIFPRLRPDLVKTLREVSVSSLESTQCAGTTLQAAT